MGFHKRSHESRTHSDEGNQGTGTVVGADVIIHTNEHIQRDKIMIEQYFDKYPGYIFSINQTMGVKTIHFWMKNSWGVPEGLLSEAVGFKEDRKQTDKNDQNRHYCIVYDNTPEPSEGEVITKPSFDDLYSIISGIFEGNLERERKEELLAAKMLELQEKFNNMSLDELQKMDFK